MPSAWNMFVKKIYEEGKAKDSKYEFKQALVDASKRKGEMGSEVKKGKTAKRSRGRKASKSTRRRHRRTHKR
jgi:hypothetical protein